MLGDFPVRRQLGWAVPSAVTFPRRWDTRKAPCGMRLHLSQSTAQPGRGKSREAGEDGEGRDNGDTQRAQPAGTRSPPQDTGEGSGRGHPRFSHQRERGKGPASKNDWSSDVELIFERRKPCRARSARQRPLAHGDLELAACAGCRGHGAAEHGAPKWWESLMQELRAAGQARAVPLSAGASSGLCHLGLATFCPSSPHPLSYFLLGLGAKAAAAAERAGTGEAREAPDVTKAVEFEPFGVRLPGHGAGEGSEAEGWKSSCRQGGIAPADSPALPSPSNPHPRPPQGWGTRRCLCITCCLCGAVARKKFN